MPRVELLDADRAPLAAQQYFSAGDPGPIVAALATVPELLAPTLGFIGAALGAGAASTRLKEFAILRTSALLGCDYCIRAHTAVSLDVGLTTVEVGALRGEVAIEEAFTSDAERVLIGWIDAMAGATAFWGSFGPTVRAGRLDTDLVLTRTILPLEMVGAIGWYLVRDLDFATTRVAMLGHAKWELKLLWFNGLSALLTIAFGIGLIFGARQRFVALAASLGFGVIAVVALVQEHWNNISTGPPPLVGTGSNAAFWAMFLIAGSVMFRADRRRT